MTPKTQSDYEKLAANFYATRLAGQQPTPKRLADALKAAATSYRPGYWRRLRNALAYDQERQGFKAAADRLRSTKNPVTAPGSQLKPKAKQKRVRAVVPADESAMLEHFRTTGDREAYGAVMLAKLTGARPAEMPTIRVDGDRVFITGAKKSHGGTRGADRVMVVGSKQAEMVAACVKHLERAGMGPVQDRISAAGHRLWPQRKAVPSLYTWRHQLGSNLKASRLDRKEIAYLMGHQSTASVDRYGNRRTGKNGKVPRAEPEQTFENIREKHAEPPAANLEAKISEIAELRQGYQLLQGRENAAKLRRYNEKSHERQWVEVLQP